MDIEQMCTQMEQDFYELAEQYEVAASNERLWAKGSNDAETASMHEENAEANFQLAKVYRRMALEVLSFVESYYDDSEWEFSDEDVK